MVIAEQERAVRAPAMPLMPIIDEDDVVAIIVCML
jgi:hypothetical protein